MEGKCFMRILLTGGAGFIGSHLTSYFLDKGHSVECLDNLSTGSESTIAGFKSHPRYRFVLGGVENENLLEPMMAGSDVVFHLAATVGVKKIVENPIETIDNNIIGTRVALKFAERLKKRLFVFSTSEVYGKSADLPFQEGGNVVLGPSHKLRWAYAGSKLIDEYMAQAYFNTYGTRVTTVRLFNTIGRNQVGFYGMVVPRFFTQALAGHPLTVYGDGQQTRSFTDVRDVAEALNSLIDCERSYGEIVNIGQSEEISVLDLAKQVRKMTHSTSEIRLIPFEEVYGKNFEDMDRRVPDTAKLRGLTGYRFRFHLNDTLKWIHAGMSLNRAGSLAQDLNGSPAFFLDPSVTGIPSAEVSS